MAKPRLGRDAARALRELKRHGLLLLSDPALPSLVALVAGAPVRGSWWAHEKGKAIFAAAMQLEDHPDVALVRLVSGKVTFVHRALFPALLAVVTPGEPWQRRGLAPRVRTLLARVEKEGVLRADAVPGGRERARILERRLLVHTREVHTAGGRHEKELESWARWARRRRVKPARSVRLAQDLFDGALLALVRESGGATGTLPWH
jgi:hypothetical protein